MMSLDDTGKAFALGGAADVHLLSRSELLDGQGFAQFGCRVVQSEFEEPAAGRGAMLGVMAGHGLRKLGRLARSRRDLHSVVAVRLRRFPKNDAVILSLNH